MSDEKKDTNEDTIAVLIKKYANRRLYHTVRSCYVTLEDLSQMVKDGVDFIVQDAKSGEDITRSVLNQIIFDAENSGNMMLPTPFLREIIKLYGDSMESFVPSYLENAMKNFMSHQDQIRESFAKNPAMLGFEQMSKMNSEWINQSMKMFGAMAQVPTAKPAEPSASSDSELQELKTQLREMQDKLSKLVND